MAKRDRKPSKAPWVIAAAAGAIFAASNGGVPDSAASAAESKPSSSGAVVAQAAKDAGWPKADLVKVVAVGFAESSWNTDATQQQ
jgi:hypothetical protein